MTPVKDHQDNQGRDSCLEHEHEHEHGHGHGHGHGEAPQGKAGKTVKRKLPSPAEDLEAGAVAKKRRYSADDAVTFLPREPPWEGSKYWERKFVTMPERTRKRQASPATVTECWPEHRNKKQKLPYHHDASRDARLSSLRGGTAEAHRLDGHRTPARKRSCPLPSDSTDCFSKSKRRKETNFASQQGSSLREETTEAHRLDGHHTSARKNSLCFSKSKKPSGQFFHGCPKADPQEVKAEVQELGVRLFERHEVKVMTDACCDVLGEGKYGSCIKTVDPTTGHQLVIKTFFCNNLFSMIRETRNLFNLQVEGVQRLVGVCVDDVQIISHFAGVSANDYFDAPVPVPLGDAAAVFMQLSQTLRRVVARGYNHCDLHGGNVCVLQGSGSPVVTLIDLGLTYYLGAKASEANEIPDLGTMMDRLMLPDKECTQHPLVADLITWMEASTTQAHHSLEALEHVLRAILEHVSQPTLPGSSPPREDLLMTRREKRSDDERVCAIM